MARDAACRALCTITHDHVGGRTRRARRTRGAAMFHVAWLPGPRVFGLVLPVAVAALFIVEFMLRPRWLPDVPRHGLLSFARRLILAWPTLLDDR